MSDSLSAQWIIIEDDVVTFFIATVTRVVFRRSKVMNQWFCVKELYLELYLIWLDNLSVTCKFQNFFIYQRTLAS